MLKGNILRFSGMTGGINEEVMGFVAKRIMQDIQLANIPADYIVEFSWRAYSPSQIAEREKAAENP